MKQVPSEPAHPLSQGICNSRESEKCDNAAVGAKARMLDAGILVSTFAVPSRTCVGVETGRYNDNEVMSTERSRS